MEKKNLELVRKLRRELHQHPELSNREVWTKHHFMTFLQTHTHLELVDRGAWFYAVYRRVKEKGTLLSGPILTPCRLMRQYPFRTGQKFRGFPINADMTGMPPVFADSLWKLTKRARTTIFIFFFNMRRKRETVLWNACRF